METFTVGEQQQAVNLTNKNKKEKHLMKQSTASTPCFMTLSARLRLKDTESFSAALKTLEKLSIKTTKLIVEVYQDQLGWIPVESFWLENGELKSQTGTKPTTELELDIRRTLSFAPLTKILGRFPDNIITSLIGPLIQWTYAKLRYHFGFPSYRVIEVTIYQ